jgi:hypothetical protein
VKLAAYTFAGIRTQPWEIIPADSAPAFLELNFGGDLNLHQLAHGRVSWTSSVEPTSGAAATRDGSDLIFEVPFARRPVSIDPWRSMT